MQSLSNPARARSFFNAPGGCGKTQVFKATLKMARGKCLVALLAASSGIAGVCLRAVPSLTHASKFQLT
eukprot:349674-Chlamydomonas_euryale.AAC.6